VDYPAIGAAPFNPLLEGFEFDIRPNGRTVIRLVHDHFMMIAESDT
jgi:hypothetical protein